MWSPRQALRRQQRWQRRRLKRQRSRLGQRPGRPPISSVFNERADSMADIAKRLSDQDVAAVAACYQQLRDVPVQAAK